MEEDDILSTEKLPDITALWRCVLKGRIMIYVGFQFGNVGKGEPTLVFLTCLPGSHYSYNSGPSRHHSKLRIKLNLQNSNVFSFLLARTKCLNYATWGRTKEGRVRSQRTIIFTKILPSCRRSVHLYNLKLIQVSRQVGQVSADKNNICNFPRCLCRAAPHSHEHVCVFVWTELCEVGPGRWWRHLATRAWNEDHPKVREYFTITISTRAFSWLKAPTSAFTFKTLLRHYAKRALTPR